MINIEQVQEDIKKLPEDHHSKVLNKGCVADQKKKPWSLKSESRGRTLSN